MSDDNLRSDKFTSHLSHRLGYILHNAAYCDNTVHSHWQRTNCMMHSNPFQFQLSKCIHHRYPYPHDPSNKSSNPCNEHQNPNIKANPSTKEVKIYGIPPIINPPTIPIHTPHPTISLNLNPNPLLTPLINPLVQIAH
jgi:hypothetical protein